MNVATTVDGTSPPRGVDEPRSNRSRTTNNRGEETPS